MITLTPACKTNTSQKMSLENNDNLRDASFSSYLNSGEETHVRKLAESSRCLSPMSPIIAAREEQLNMGGKKEEDGEIGVFGAEKYFNGGTEESPRIPSLDQRKYQYSKKHEEAAYLDPVKPKIQPQTQTPSVVSESSWNSQSTLIQSVLRNQPRSKTNKGHGKRFLASFGCNCVCSDKNSVDVDEHVGEVSFNRGTNHGLVHGKTGTKEPIKTGPDNLVKDDLPCKKLDKLGIGLNTENCFAFPSKGQIEEKARKSLEVFGSPVLEKMEKTLSLERRLTMFSWDATPRVEELEIPEAYNDAGSDASSDLFEIESVTGKANPFLTRQASNATSGCVTPTTCYAPSEASIEWSVVTASAVDFSVMSDYEELRPATTIGSPIKAFSPTNSKARTSKEVQRRRPSMLLGCKSHKAVRVAGDAYTTNEKFLSDPRIHLGSDPSMPVSRFQAETKLISFDSRQVQVAPRSLPRSQSPRASHLLYI